ncbi:hypothetical protein NPD5_3735 [Clostridium sporogenes]|uniref:Uncharacterized protein n=1 Tax=Clostridium sporogenes TaxID=1509 RepID=A0A1L3NBV0_CLOSG|nr:hypothetical protein NPD5_3735 [Clostridium sporogenes]
MQAKWNSDNDKSMEYNLLLTLKTSIYKYFK